MTALRLNVYTANRLEEYRTEVGLAHHQIFAKLEACADRAKAGDARVRLLETLDNWCAFLGRDWYP